MRSFTLTFVVCVALGVASSAAAQQPADATQSAEKAAADKAALEAAFAEQMSGATLVGYYTVSGREDRDLKEERYTISKVTKINGDLWLFNARVQYGGKDTTVPMPLAVIWSGDTPVITLTDFPIPTLGTYTARVLIYRGQYAGTWSGSDHGGHLFGKIIKEEAASDEPAASDAAANPADGGSAKKKKKK